MPSRHRRLLAIALVVTGLAAVGVGLYSRLWPIPRAPHPLPRGERALVLVTLDTTRPDHLQPYGSQDVETPTLQGLADRGVTFEHAYSVAPITLVAHTSIHTGLYPPQHGVRDNGIHYVPDEVETLAERLHAEGYATAAFVSAAVLDRRYHLDQGFDVYDDDLSAGRERHRRMVADRPADATVDAARAWLDGLKAGRRFFLWVHFYDPHAAYSPPPPYRDRYRDRLYDGEIAFMDSQLGRLLTHPLLADPDTLVMVIGDHGESLGEHGEQTHALLAYDSTLHVPWIARIPGVQRGLRVAGNVGQADLVPTVLDLLGMAPDRHLPGLSLVPLLDGSARSLPHDLYSETYLPYYTYGWAKLRVLRRGSWKWIDGPRHQLYDLSRDPGELTDVASQEPGLTHDLARDLGEMVASLGPEERESALPLDSEAAEKLRSLGYLAVGSRQSRKGKERADPSDMVDLHVALERSRALLDQRLYPQAETELRRVLARDPGNLSALSDLATAQAGQDRLDDAAATMEQALSLDPTYPRFHLLLAGLESRRGHRERALELVDSALKLDPHLSEAEIQKAALLRQTGRPAEARKTLDAALDADPDDPPLNAAYAQMAEMAAGDFAAAEARLRKALERDPFLVSGWRLLGQTLEQTGRGGEAVDAYREGLRRRPDDADLHARLGLLLARSGGPPETEAHLREAQRLSETPRPELSVALGAWLAEHGRYQEAEKEYAKVLAVEPRNPGARNNRAIAYYRTGRTAEAEKELLALLEDFPHHGDAHNNLAAIYLERGDWADAEHHARAALAAEPRMTEAWNNLGYALQGLDRGAEAQKAYRRALTLEPEYWQARFNLGVSLARADRAAEAEHELEAVVRQVPGFAGADFELAELYRGPLADPARARRYYNAFLRLEPKGSRAAAARRHLAELPLK